MKKCFFVGPASARSNKTVVVGNNWVGWLVIWLFGWLVGWLVGNAVFSETCSKEFSDFLHKVRSYKGRKVTEPDF